MKRGQAAKPVSAPGFGDAIIRDNYSITKSGSCNFSIFFLYFWLRQIAGAGSMGSHSPSPCLRQPPAGSKMDPGPVSRRPGGEPDPHTNNPHKFPKSLQNWPLRRAPYSPSPGRLAQRRLSSTAGSPNSTTNPHSNIRIKPSRGSGAKKSLR